MSMFIPILLMAAWSGGFGGHEIPSDNHSTFNIEYTDKNGSRIQPGIQQIMFLKSGERLTRSYRAIVTAAVEWKSPLEITPEDIDEILQGLFTQNSFLIRLRKQ